MRDSAGKVRDSIRDVTDDKTDFSKLMESMTKQEKTIYDAIKITREITAGEIEKLLNVKIRRAELILKENMVDSGLIRRVGTARNTKYVLSDL